MKIAVSDDRGDKGSLLFMSDIIAVANSVDAVVILEEAREMEAGLNGTLASALLDWLFGASLWMVKGRSKLLRAAILANDLSSSSRSGTDRDANLHKNYAI